MGLLGAGEVDADYRTEGFAVKFSAPLRQLQGEGRLLTLLSWIRNASFQSLFVMISLMSSRQMGI